MISKSLNSSTKQSTNYTTTFLNTKIQNRFQIKQVIKIGPFGGIFKAIDLQQHNQSVTIKIIDTKQIKKYSDKFQNPKLQTQRLSIIQRQIYELKNQYHPKIIKLIDNYSINGYQIIIIKYNNDGTLINLLQKYQYLQLDHAINIIKQISQPIAIMHLQGVTHYCLKPQSVYIHNGECYIGDFGVNDLIMGTDRQKITQPPGFNTQKHKLGIDFYSMGILLFIMINTDKSIVEKARKIRYDNLDTIQWPKNSQLAKAFIKKCLNYQMTWKTWKQQPLFNTQNQSQQFSNVYYINHDIKLTQDICGSKFARVSVCAKTYESNIQINSSNIQLNLNQQIPPPQQNNLSGDQQTLYKKMKQLHFIAKRCQYIYKKILLECQNWKPFDLKNNNGLQILYMLSRICFFDIIEIEKNMLQYKNQTIVQNFINSYGQKIQKLSKKVKQKFYSCSEKLSQSQKQIKHRIGYTIKKLFNKQNRLYKDNLFYQSQVQQTQNRRLERIKWIKQALLDSSKINQKNKNDKLNQLHARFKIFDLICSFNMQKQENEKKYFHEYVNELVEKNKIK